MLVRMCQVGLGEGSALLSTSREPPRTEHAHDNGGTHTEVSSLAGPQPAYQSPVVKSGFHLTGGVTSTTEGSL